jgi:hypothetical protein
MHSKVQAYSNLEEENRHLLIDQQENNMMTSGDNKQDVDEDMNSNPEGIILLIK